MIILPFGILSDTDHTATEQTVRALNMFFLSSLLFLVTDNHVGMCLEFDYTAKWFDDGSRLLHIQSQLFVAVAALTRNASSTNWACMRARLTQYTYNNDCLPTTVLKCLSATVNCTSNLPQQYQTTSQLHNYRTSHTGEGTKQNVRARATEDIYNISECVPLRTYATYQDVCHWGYVQCIRTYAREYMQHVRMCQRIYAQHVRMCATEDTCSVRRRMPEDICNMPGRMPEDTCNMSGCYQRIHATCKDVCQRIYATEVAIPYVVRIHLMLGHTKSI